MNKKAALLMLLLAIVAVIVYLVTESTLYLVLAGVNLCAALAGFFNNRVISSIFMLIGAAGMIYVLVAMIRALLLA